MVEVSSYKLVACAAHDELRGEPAEHGVGGRPCSRPRSDGDEGGHDPAKRVFAGASII